VSKTDTNGSRFGKNSTRLIVSVLAIAIITVSVLGAGWYVIAPHGNTSSQSEIGGVFSNSSEAVNSAVKPCSFEIFLNGSFTAAQYCAGGAILDYSTDAAGVIDDAIGNLTFGGIIFIKSGTYTLTTGRISLGNFFGGAEYAALGSTSVSNIEITGEGNATVLTAETNLNHAMIGTNGVSGWYIHNLQINGNRAKQNASAGSPPYLMCVLFYGGNSMTVSNLYVHDCKTDGIWVGYSSYDTIESNLVVNSNSNGITLNSAKYGRIFDNTVNGSSDIGIDVSGGSTGFSQDNIVRGNQVLNGNLDVSPFPGANSGWGIAVGDTGYANESIISQNIVDGAKYGLVSVPGNHTDYAVSFLDNTVDNSESLAIAENTSGLVLTGNQFVTYNHGLDIRGSVYNVTITDNEFSGIPGAGAIDILFYGPNRWITIAANTFVDDSTELAIDLVSSQHFTIDNNLFNDATSGSGAAIKLENSDQYGEVIGNDFYQQYNAIYFNTVTGNITVANNTFDQVSYAIYGYAPSDYLTVIGNVYTKARGGNLVYNTHYLGNHTRIMDNEGYNPIGPVTNFLLTGGTTQPGDGDWLSPFGTSSLLAAATTYTVTIAPCRITFQKTGSNVSVSIDGGTGFSPTVGESFLLYPSETVNFGNFSTAPTLEVNFT